MQAIAPYDTNWVLQMGYIPGNAPLGAVVMLFNAHKNATNCPQDRIVLTNTEHITEFFTRVLPTLNVMDFVETMQKAMQ
jgi:hypothetical protein